MKIAFVHQMDPAVGASSWVGMLPFFKETFSRHVGTVIDLGPAQVNLTPYRAARKLVRLTMRRNYSFYHDPNLSRRVAGYFSRKLAAEKVDLIFAPGGSGFVPFLETDVPIIGYSDATWRLANDYHNDFSKMIPWNARWADELERRTLERVAIMLYPSEWAAGSAVKDYGADPAKIYVNFIGANLTSPPARDEVLPRRLGRSIRLLMVGYAWEAKGADIAYETLLKLLEDGHDAYLTVVGCTPPEEIRHPRLEIIPRLNKSIPADAERFNRLWRDSDFFILPTRSEAAGIVFCEASAFALPSIATRTGGVPWIVREGANGYTLPPEARGDAYAAVIAGLAADHQRYERLCHSSREEFETRLNWDAWGRAAAAAIAERFPELRGRLPD